jgi:hypothetical protein
LNQGPAASSLSGSTRMSLSMLVSAIGTTCQIDAAIIYARHASLLTSLVCTSAQEDF